MSTGSWMQAPAADGSPCAGWLESSSRSKPTTRQLGHGPSKQFSVTGATSPGDVKHQIFLVHFREIFASVCFAPQFYPFYHPYMPSLFQMVLNLRNSFCWFLADLFLQVQNKALVQRVGELGLSDSTVSSSFQDRPAQRSTSFEWSECRIVIGPIKQINRILVVLCQDEKVKIIVNRCFPSLHSGGAFDPARSERPLV